MPDIRQLENLFITLSGDGATDLICLAARVREGLSLVPEMRMEFVSKNTDFDPATIIGKRIKLETEQGFKWSGLVIQVEDLGLMSGGDVFAAELRPWLWVAGIGEENRIYQNMTTTQIIEDVLKPLGGQMDVGVSSPTREYCVQYKESNFAFVSRLMEEDGIFYHFDYEGAVEKLVLQTDIMACTDKGTIPFTDANISAFSRADRDTIYEWSTRDRATSGKVTIWDYDFTKANTPLSATGVKSTSSAPHGTTERYQSGGHFMTADAGSTLARYGAEAHAAEAVRATGLTNHVDVRSGAKFKLKHPDRPAVEGNYAVIKTTHYVRFDDGAEGTELSRINRHAEVIEFPDGMKLYETEFEVQPVEKPYYPPKVTPWPELPSLLTAVVTGPSGEEIHTDQYGRIKVQFPWDRKGKNDDKTTCWVRTVMPWTGKGYGIVHIPRIGMEVVIQFERGNIDRPICTGMLYNSTNMPPYPLPGDMNKVVLRTHSTKNGSASTYHELSFDDTKDAEKIFFQSEKDYEQKVKNNALINIGMEKKDGGDLTQTVYRHTTETVKTGNRKLTVEKGSETVSIAANQTHTVGENRSWEVGKNDKLKVGIDRDETIGSNHTESVGSNYSLTIGSKLAVSVGAAVTVDYGADETKTVASDQSETVGGDHTESIGGSQSLDVGKDQSASIGSSQSLSVGTSQAVDVGTSQAVSVGTSHALKAGTSVAVKAGTTMKLEATASIELVCMGSSIKIDPSGITIKGPMITIEGQGMVQVKAPLVQNQAQGILILKGGVTMIN